MITVTSPSRTPVERLIHRRPLGDLATLIRESTVPTLTDERPYVALENVTTGDVRIQGWAEASSARSSKFIFRSGDVLYGKLRPYLNKAAIATFDGVASTDFLVLRPRDGIDPSFLVYTMHTRRLLEHAISTTSGVNHPRTSWPSLKELLVFSPSLDEQCRIAGILSAIQRSKEMGEAVASSVNHIRQRLLVDSFAQNWPTVSIGDFAKVGNGSTPKRDNERYWQEGTIPWLTSGKIHDGIITSADQFVTEVAAKECHLPEVPSGSVLVAITGQGKTLGNAALLSVSARVSQHLAYIRFTRDDVVPEYLYYYLSSRYEHLRSIAFGGGSTKGALTCGYLSSYPVPLPSREEQLQVVRHLTTVDQKLAAEAAAVRSLESVFSSALSVLLEPAA